MCEALEFLFGGKCFHFHRVLLTNEHLSMLSKATKGEDDTNDWVSLLEGYHAAVGSPFAGYWHILKDIYPDAKVILLWRDSESWYESFSKALFPTFRYHGTLSYYLLYYTWPKVYIRMPFYIKLYRRLLGTDFLVCDKKELIRRFEAYYQALKLELHSHNIPVYIHKLGDGWPELCKFLKVPIPDGTPFPRTRTKDTTVVPRFLRRQQTFIYMFLSSTAIVLIACIFLAIFQ